MAYIGPGFIILAVIWIISVVLCIIFSRADGPLAFVGIVFILIALIVTLVLWFYPRGVATVEPYVIYDYTYIPRTALVSVCGVLLFVGLVFLGLFHIFDQKHGTPLKPWVY